METTAEYILEKIAPIFNKQGYVGTSLSDLTQATNLTKGAIYCNFKNKEELAIKAFKLNVQKVIFPLQDKMAEKPNAVDKLLTITSYYRNYYEMAKERGGCPILNVGVDAKFNNPTLYEASKNVSKKLISGMTKTIQTGIDNNEIKDNVNSKTYARNIYSMIEGGIFMATLQEDTSYLDSVLDIIDGLIEEKLKK